MNALLTKAIFASALLLSATFANADEAIREARNVDARTSKIKLGGVLSLTVKQGNTPSLTLYGDKEFVSAVTLTQSGDTLIIDTTKRKWPFKSTDGRALRAELILPKLSEFDSYGVGSTELQGFSGEMLKVNLDGAGSLTAKVQYKNIAALGWGRQHDAHRRTERAG